MLCVLNYELSGFQINDMTNRNKFLIEFLFIISRLLDLYTTLSIPEMTLSLESSPIISSKWGINVRKAQVNFTL